MTIEWHRLRTWNGSQDNAFEELCCQLAAAEDCLPGSRFVRKGAPDAGVECYWTLPSGEELAWQAKFFRNIPTGVQWSQIDESVMKAMAKHKALVRYTICIPLNRQDPRKKKEEWFQDKWNIHVKKWMGWARKKKMSVDFQYWGESEIFRQLSETSHAGRFYFWFKEEFLGQSWFENALDKVIENAGPRYSPDLNVNLPISRLFDGLGRTTEFRARITDFLARLTETWRGVLKSDPAKTKACPCVTSLQNTVTRLFTACDQLLGAGMEPMNYSAVSALCEQARDEASRCSKDIEAFYKSKAAAGKGTKGRTGTQLGDPHYDPAKSSLDILNRFKSALNHLQNFLETKESLLANKPKLLLIGDAGTGKTHLFCDAARERLKEGLPTVVLLGEQFNDTEPWNQIIKLLGLSCRNEAEFLGALEASAECNASRALIFIDALNEGEGKVLWRKHIGGILSAIAHYPYIGLAVSVRSSYERLIIPEEMMGKHFIREVHQGFVDHEYDATGTFFRHFNIHRPAVPMLVPEFQNPLFLMIFCKSLSNNGLTAIPPGLEGISRVFEFYLDSVNTKLARQDELDFDVHAKLVHIAIKNVAEKMANAKTNKLSYDVARGIVESVLPRQEHSRGLFNGLISEGVLSRDIAYQGHSETEEVIRFSYERFSDHLIAGFILDRYLDAADPSQSFGLGNPLGEFIKNETVLWESRGLIEAFSVQIPEKTNRELVELAPAIKTYQPTIEAFLQSLLWRKASSIGAAALTYVNDTIMKSEHYRATLYNTLLTIAPKSDHPFNAQFLHRNLKRYTLAERDAVWSIFLHRHYGAKGAVDRLLDWAWTLENRETLHDTPMHLLAIALAWFLTSSNRFLRDKATKALVILLKERTHLLARLIQEFHGTNDPYVLERLLAVSYGSVMRNTNTNGLRELAIATFQRYFADGFPPPHLLLRDYARGIIEVALHRGLQLEIDESKIRPPYRSEWNPPSLSKDEIEAKYYPKDMKNARGYGDIWLSVMSFGDFARYIIGTNSGNFPWTSQRLRKRRLPSRKERFDTFLQSLTSQQQKAYERYESVRFAMSIQRFKFSLPKNVRSVISKTSETTLDRAQSLLYTSLSKAQKKQFREVVLPHLANAKDESEFDLSVAQCWIFQRVIELGWTPQLFEEFDTTISYRGWERNSDKAERIGKKYQWLAFHEFLARVSDNFVYRQDKWSTDSSERYEGPWQHYWRDIDPSLILPKRNKKDSSIENSSPWWVPFRYAWKSAEKHSDWIKRADDLPKIESLISFESSEQNAKWITLEGLFKSSQPDIGVKDHDKRKKDWFILLKSYLVKKRDLKAVFEWGLKQDFIGRWMPEAGHMTKVFIGEYPWAPSCLNLNADDQTGWTRGDRDNRLIPKPVLITNNEYLWERGYDCSIDESVSMNLPTEFLINKMKLQWSAVPGVFTDVNGTVVFQDPSVEQNGPSVLLVREDRLLSFLQEHEYAVVWAVLGEKNLIGGNVSPTSERGTHEVTGMFYMGSQGIKGKSRRRYRKIS